MVDDSVQGFLEKLNELKGVKNDIKCFQFLKIQTERNKKFKNVLMNLVNKVNFNYKLNITPIPIINI